MSRSPEHPLEASQRQRRVIVRVVRMAFFIVICTVALVTVIQRASDQGSDQPGFTTPARQPVTSGNADTPTPRPSPPVTNTFSPEVEMPWWLPVAIAVVLFSVVVLIDLATPNKKISSISGVLFGLLAGILATVAISAVIELALQVWLPERALLAIRPLILLIKPLLGIALCYLGITTVLQTQDDFRLVIPYVEFSKQLRGAKPMVLDSSALIDARIADLCATGVLQAPIIIPRFVLSELQALADSADKMKRARGRRGLEVVTRLQRQGTIDVTIDETPVAAIAVDQMLVELAKTLAARVVTTDLGLTRVAQIHGVAVINVHEVAAACKPALIPGEQIVLKPIKGGEQPGQGVGYLDDGTMVVVEGGAPLIGRESSVMVTSTLQTSGGRMVFARPVNPPAPEAASHEAQAEPPSPPDVSVQTHDGAWTVEEPAEDTPAPEPEPRSTEPAAAAEPPTARSGPFPPKPAHRKPPSLRNPRR